MGLFAAIGAGKWMIIGNIKWVSGFLLGPILHNSDKYTVYTPDSYLSN